jgi:hypothetical protein
MEYTYYAYFAEGSTCTIYARDQSKSLSINFRCLCLSVNVTLWTIVAKHLS